LAKLEAKNIVALFSDTVIAVGDDSDEAMPAPTVPIRYDSITETLLTLLNPHDPNLNSKAN